MIILGQSLEENENAAYANAFFVGMSKQEYYLQVRHKIGDIGCGDDKWKEEIIDDNYARLISNENAVDDSKNIYGTDKLFEVYVCIKRDLSSGFISFFNYPVANQWNGYSPWERYPDHTELERVEQIAKMPFYDWKKKKFFPVYADYNAIVNGKRLANRRCAQEERNHDEISCIVATNISNTCEKCIHSVHWELRKALYCAEYEQKPYDVYFEGAPCPKFQEIDELPGAPKKQ